MPPEDVDEFPLMVHVSEHVEPDSVTVHDTPMADPEQPQVDTLAPPASMVILQQDGELEPPLLLLEHAVTFAMTRTPMATRAMKWRSIGVPPALAMERSKNDESECNNLCLRGARCVRAPAE